MELTTINLGVADHLSNNFKPNARSLVCFWTAGFHITSFWKENCQNTIYMRVCKSIVDTFCINFIFIAKIKHFLSSFTITTVSLILWVLEFILRKITFQCAEKTYPFFSNDVSTLLMGKVRTEKIEKCFMFYIIM